MKLSPIEKKALELLATPQSCTSLGELLWLFDDQKRRISAMRQSYARPAGKIVKKLRGLGLVQIYYDKSQRFRTLYKRVE